MHDLSYLLPFLLEVQQCMQGLDDTIRNRGRSDVMTQALGT